MFQKRRSFKKERSKFKFRYIYSVLIFSITLALVGSFLYYNFSFGKSVLINPLSKNYNSFESKLKDELGKQNIKYLRTTLNSDGSVMVNREPEGEIIFTPKKEISDQITSLQLVLSRLTIEGKKLKTLDFRFANPVVSFN